MAKRNRSRWAGWKDLGSDSDWESYGGKWGRKGADGAWYIVRFENMIEACGERAVANGEISKYIASVLRVDLSEISKDQLSKCRACVGIDPDDYDSRDANVQEYMNVDACVSYGTFAPLWDEGSDTFPMRLRAAARREAETMMRDETTLDKALDRTVNRIGTTAREFGQGDPLAGLHRHASNVMMGETKPGEDPEKDLMLKLSFGASADQIAPPSDDK